MMTMSVEHPAPRVPRRHLLAQYIRNENSMCKFVVLVILAATSCLGAHLTFAESVWTAIADSQSLGEQRNNGVLDNDFPHPVLEVSTADGEEKSDGSASNDLELNAYPGQGYRPYHYVGDRGWRQQATCGELLNGTTAAQNRVISYLSNSLAEIPSSEDVLEATKNCSPFLERYHYRQTPASEEEARYPIAYSVMIYKDAAQFEMLLRAIYHPQNVHCIHVDTTADSEFKAAIRSLVSCFDNVFLTSHLVDVVYGGVSRLEADFSCMRDLLLSKVPWKYLINLTGQEFPIKTNYEIVQILKSLRNKTDLDVNMASFQKWRITNHWHVVEGKKGKSLVEIPDSKKEPPPDGVRLAKGGAYGLFGRDFLSYVLSMPSEVKMLFDWLSDIWSPDEMFWATIYMRKYNPMFESPGGYDSNSGKVTHKSFLAKAVVWEEKGANNQCKGKYLRYICIFNSTAMPFLVAQQELFANKFVIHYDHVILNCLGEWIQARTDVQPPFQTQIYEEFAARHFGSTS